ncbi:MAG TPA: GNAT family N-acetyltransferase [Pseudonocardia sp.]|nr:GNAT family N-acetyltransferase [Pseudonocardia sp.]
MSSDSFHATVRRAWAADLEANTLYALLKLRVDVFVVEQKCAYPELDGRDLEPRARHYWLTGDGDPPPVLGTVRLLKEPDGSYRIGRLCTATAYRGRALGKRLMDAVMAEVGDGECVADVQSHLVEFYAAYGFVAEGDAYDWDGVMHIRMRRARRGTAS